MGRMLGKPSKKVADQMKGLGSRVRTLREQRQLSQQELAEMVGLHKTQLGRVERGTNVPQASTVLALANALRTTTDALLRGERNGHEALEIQNLRLFERFRALEALSRTEQETAITLIDALVARHKIRDALTS